MIPEDIPFFRNRQHKRRRTPGERWANATLFHQAEGDLTQVLDAVETLFARLSERERELKHLRHALSAIIIQDQYPDPYPEAPEGLCAKIARAALAEESPS